MKIKDRGERGDTLIEILLAIIVMGVVVSGLFYSIQMASATSATQRNLVTADTVLRDYAENAKQAVRNTCTSNPPNTGTPFTVAYTPPTGFVLTATGPNGLTCPSPTTVNEIDIKVTVPSGAPGASTRALNIDVRTP